MNLIRVYLDFGSGYELTNPSYSGNLINENDKNPFIFRKRAEITAIFYGNDYDKINIQLASNIELPFKIELYDKELDIYKEFVSGYVNIRGKKNTDEQTIELTDFVAKDKYSDIYDILDKEEEYLFDSLMKETCKTELRQYITETSKNVYNVPVLTTLDKDEYITGTSTVGGHTIEGNQLIVGAYDDRWDYFTWEYTDTIVSEYKHYYVSQKIGFPAPTYNEISFTECNKDFRYSCFVKNNFTTHETVTKTFTGFYTLTDVLDALLEKNNYLYGTGSYVLLNTLKISDLTKALNSDETALSTKIKIIDVFNLLENNFG